MSFTTQTSRWLALTTRNETADSHFIYGVRTTKIYCRPSCPARLARRANVVFYDTPKQAVAEGYRACKRCKPDDETLQDPQALAVAKACEIIAGNARRKRGNESIEKLTGLKELAEMVGLSPWYLHKTFKAKMGLTPRSYEKSLLLCQGQEESALDLGAEPPFDIQADLGHDEWFSRWFDDGRSNSNFQDHMDESMFEEQYEVQPVLDAADGVSLHESGTPISQTIPALWDDFRLLGGEMQTHFDDDFLTSDVTWTN